MASSIKPPRRPEDITPQLVEDLKAALGADLLGVCLYGSAAQGRYEAGRSDINLLVLAADQAQDRWRHLLPFRGKWASAGVSAPLLLTPHFLATSLDVFPIEFLVMAAGHRSLWGQDPLADLDISPRMLRLQLERELRAKLIALNTRLLGSQGQDAALLQLAVDACPAFTALFQAYLRLAKGSFPLDPDQVMGKMQQEGVEVAAFVELARLRRAKSPPAAGGLMDLWDAALAQLEQLIRRVDAWQEKEGSPA